MASITNKTEKQVTLRNTIMVDNKPIKTQEFVIRGNRPEDISDSSYYINDEAKVLYKENRAAIRAKEAEFEDDVYAKQEIMFGEGV